MSGLRGSGAANNGFINLGRPGQTSFSIHDAFQEEDDDTDEMIKVYGNDGPVASPNSNNNGGGMPTKASDEGSVKIRMESEPR